MKALFVDEARRPVLREVPVPRIGPGELLVRMKACGICGTDLEKLRGWSLTPVQLGHEVAGEVEQVGEGASDLRPGTRVVVHHHVSCGACYYCLHDQPTLCELFPKSNLDPGGFSEFFRVPKMNVERGGVLPLPSGLTYEEGALVEPLACCIRALRRFNYRSPMSVAVFGAGPMGLLFVKLLLNLGAGPLLVFDVRERRLQAAKDMGVDIAASPLREDPSELSRRATEGRGVDLAIVATSSIQAAQQALRALRKGGTLGIFGAPEAAPLLLNLQDLFIGEVSIAASYSTSEAEMRAALTLLSGRRLVVSDLVTHRFPLSEAVEAFRVAEQGEGLKVMVLG
ncbi:MAG: alcohol dehydrogenase [Nitrososphaerota archaeon]